MIESLKKIKKVGQFDIICYNPNTEEVSAGRNIVVNERDGSIEIPLQTGTISEVGLKGLQIDDFIELCYLILAEFNERSFCFENESALNCLADALSFLLRRRLRRTAKGVEGTKKEEKIIESL